MNPSPKTCPRCQTPIPADAPGELCPGCLLLEAVAPAETAGGVFGSAPTVEEVAAAFPDLEIVEMIGHGGMGVVFKARQTRLGRLIALKILPPGLAGQPGFVERFNREARALARLNHPNIVAVYDFGESAGFCYLLMEYVTGVNLRQAMRAGVKPEQALTLVPQICEALQFAHDHGVLHRDIKPENILLDTAGKPKLADFGIAKLADDKASSAGLTLSGAALGTAAYMAPEQIEKPGTVDHRADIYSLGVVLYEMLTGELPLGRFAAPSEKSGVAQGVDEVVMRALEKERERRQQTATQMKTEVEYANTAAGSGGRASDEEWMLRCPACGKARRLSEAGGVRMGAASIGKRTFGKCSHCGFQGMLDVITARELRTVPYTPDPVAARQRVFSSGRWPLWKISLGFTLLATPLAVMVALFAMPALQSNGFPVYASVALSVGLGLLLLAGVWLFVAALIGIFRFLTRAGVPVWLAGSAVAVTMVIFPLAIVLWLLPAQPTDTARPQPVHEGESHSEPVPKERSPRRPRSIGPSAGDNASQAQSLHDEAIRLAKDHLAKIKARYEGGFASVAECGDAQRDLAVAEARGDEKKVLEARISFAEKALGIEQQRFESGMATKAEVEKIKLQINGYRQQLLKLQPATPEPPKAKDGQAASTDKIKIAEMELRNAEQRVALGVAYAIESSLAERNLTIARAAGDERKILEAKIKYATEELPFIRAMAHAGQKTTLDVAKCEAELEGYQKELQRLGAQGGEK